MVVFVGYNMIGALDPSSKVIKRLWCIIPTQNMGIY